MGELRAQSARVPQHAWAHPGQSRLPDQGQRRRHARAQGRPINRALRLSGQSRNLFGADSDPGNPTRFYKYFAHPNEQGKVNAVFRMNPDGTYQQISLGSIVEQNQAYWIGATQDLPTHGPIAPDVPLEGLQFAKSTYSQTLTIEVPRNNIAQTITVEALASATPANGEPVDAAGNADWLEWYDETDALQPWKPLTTPVVLNVAPNQTKVELEVRCVRKGKAAATEGDPTTPGLYQGSDSDDGRLGQPAGDCRGHGSAGGARGVDRPGAPDRGEPLSGIRPGTVDGGRASDDGVVDPRAAGR
jgi:hypothetical protein